MWLPVVAALWCVATLTLSYVAFKAGWHLGWTERGIDMTLPEDSARRYRDTEPRWRDR